MFGEAPSGILIRVEKDGDNLTLRLDQNGWGSETEVQSLPVRVVTMYACRECETVFREVVKGKEQWFDYRIEPSQENNRVLLAFEDGSDYRECSVLCERVEEQDFEYTVEDVLLKLEQMTARYDYQAKESMRLNYHLEHFRVQIRRDIEQESLRCQQKLDFLQAHTETPDRLSLLEGQIKAFDRVLRLWDWPTPNPDRPTTGKS